MLPFFIHPLKRNGYYLMDRETWDMWQRGENLDGVKPLDEKYNYLLLKASLNFQEEMKGDKVLLTINTIQNEPDTNCLAAQFTSTDESQCREPVKECAVAAKDT